MNALQVRGVDPRALCTAKLHAPHHLPYVSRRALKRVKDRLDPPTRCNLCDNPVRLAKNREIYNGQDYGDWPFVYLCCGCAAYVGLHPDTDLPLRTLADRETREARKLAKNEFHRVSRKMFGSDRKEAYAWLAQTLEIDPRYAHFGFMTWMDCNRVIAILRGNEKWSN